MKISVVIPTWNRRDNVVKVIKCLLTQEIQPQHSMEIIVVDDNSTDDTTGALTQEFGDKIKVLSTPEHITWNASIPRNIGAAASDDNSDGLLFVDSDVMLPPDRIQRVIDDYLADPREDRVIIGPYNYMQNPIQWTPDWYTQNITNYAQDMRWVSFENHPVTENHIGISFGLSCFGGLLFVPRKLFFRVGGYNEEMLSGVEDGEFGLRLARYGAVFSLDKGLLGWHHPHEVHPSRTEHIRKCVDMINLEYFGSVNPDYGLIEASQEAYKQWQIDWKPPESWVK